MGTKQTSHLWAEIQAWIDVLPYPPTQTRLAARLGVTKNAVSEWKYGISRPTPENLEALADEMSAVAGPDIYPRLLTAVARDLGYDPDRGRSAS